MSKIQNIKIIKLLLVSIILLLIFGIFLLIQKNTRNNNTIAQGTENKARNTDTKEQPLIKTEVTKTIDVASATDQATLEINDLQYKEQISINTSVYDFMDKIRKQGKINFTEKNYTGIGKFIDEINGVRGNNTKSWIYYVNGEKANVGVSNYKIKKGDVVSWKYESNY